MTTGPSIPVRAQTGLPEPGGEVPAARPASRLLASVPPPGLVLVAIVSVQVGSALAVHLFAALGPIDVVFLRVGFAAFLFALWTRPPLDRKLRRHLGWVLLFGLVVAAMNLCFYQAIARIPLGVAVTIEFVGPLAVAVATSRRPLDFLWIALAAAGVAMLSPDFGRTLDPVGLLFAATAAVGWGGFVLVSKRVGSIFQGATGLTYGMVVAALLLFPFALFGEGPRHVEPLILLAGFGVAILSTTIPFSLEFEALKRLPPRRYGVLVTLEPAVAVLVGVVLLGQPVRPLTLLAVTFVTAAALGVTLFERAR
jgi:inner membrane transporter RhtA